MGSRKKMMQLLRNAAELEDMSATERDRQQFVTMTKEQILLTLGNICPETASEDLDVVNEVIMYYLELNDESGLSSHCVSTTKDYTYYSQSVWLHPAMRDNCLQFFYYYLKYYHFSYSTNRVSELLQATSTQTLSKMSDVLTLTAQLNETDVTTSVGNFIFCFPSWSCVTMDVIYLILDLGLNIPQMVDLKFWLNNSVKKSKQLPKSIVALNTAVNQPPSLLQLARLSVRKCMRDVHVLEDCYKLPIPHHLQDYLSLRSLNAKIRPWFMKQERTTLIDYEEYNPKYEVLSRCGITDFDDISTDPADRDPDNEFRKSLNISLSAGPSCHRSMAV